MSKASDSSGETRRDGASRAGAERAPGRGGRRLGWFTVLLILLVLAVGVTTAWRVWPRNFSYYTDADTIKAPTDLVTVREVLWQPPILLPEPINTPADDYEPRLSADGQTMFLVRGKAGTNADLYFTRRTRDGWTEPQALDGVNSAADDLGPEPSVDGDRLYFYSNRSGGSGGYDIWVAYLSESGGFGDPVNLGPLVNSQFNDYGPALTADGAGLYFASNRPRSEGAGASEPGAWPATVREDLYQSDYDLFVSPIGQRGVGQAKGVGVLNSVYNEGTPALSPAGDFLYFSSDRPGGEGGFDLYRSRRLRGEQLEPEHLGPTVNSSANELDPALSVGGYALHFSSDRRLAVDAPEKARDYDVYRTFSREVFAEVETYPARLDLAALWRALWPSLLWLLLAVLAALLLRALLDKAAWRKLSLLTKCILASVFAHLLLMLLLTLWEVQTSLAGLFQQRGGVRVSLAAADGGQNIASQIRGGFSDFMAPTVAELAVERHRPVSLASASERVIRRQVAPARLEAGQPMAHETTVNDSPLTERHWRARDRASAAAVAQASLNGVLDLSLPASEAATAEEEAALAFESRRPGRSTRASLATDTLVVPTRTETLAMPPSGTAMRPENSVSLAACLGSPSVEDSIPRLAPRRSLSAAAVQVHKPLGLELSMPWEEPQRSEEEQALPMAGPSVDPRAARLRPATISDAGGSEEIELPALSSSPQAPLTSALVSAVLVARESMPAFERSPRADAALDVNFPSEALDIDVPLEAEAATVPEEDRRPVGGGGLVSRLKLPDRTPVEPLDDSPIEVQPRANPWEQGASLASPTADLWAGLRAREFPAVQPRQARPFPAAPLPPPDLHMPTADDWGQVGTVYGRVMDAVTRERIAGAVVRLDLSAGEAVTATTDADGAYELAVPEVPEFFALSASAAEYLPASANVAAAEVDDRNLHVDFILRLANQDEFAVEAVPDVHHLGDDRFDGSVNSQFQKSAEGSRFRIEFELDDTRDLAYYRHAEISLLAKGVQMGHPMYINGSRLGHRLDDSPEDGSFGEFTAGFDVELLRPGVNRFEIRARSRGHDVDDFEFVNVQIRLIP